MSTSPPPPASPPLPPTPIQSGNIEFFLSGGINNPLPASSIGGALSQIVLGQIISGTPSNLFNLVTTAQAATGIPNQYRCFYVQNTSVGTTIRNISVWFETLNADQDVTFKMGLDPGGLNSTPATIANDTTAPAGVVFTQPTSIFNALYIGKLRPGDFYPIWIDRSVVAGAVSFYLDSFVVRVEGASQPDPNNVPDFGVAAAGNFSCSSVTAQQNINDIVGKITNVPPLQRFIGLGDLAIATTPACWFTMTAGIDAMTNVVLGDSEVYTQVPGSAQPALLNSYLNHYHLTTPYYSFNYGPIHFLVMNTEILYVNPSPQYNFVAADLLANSKNGNIFWTIVCMHQSMYSAAGSPYEGTYVPTSFTAAFHPLFDQYDVDLVLSAHPYNYQRTYPIIFNNPTTPTAVVTGTNTYTNPLHPIMINLGTGGLPLDTNFPFTSVPSYFAFTDNANFGYLWLAFTNLSTVCTGTFFNVGNIASDTFTITKT